MKTVSTYCIREGLSFRGGGELPSFQLLCNILLEYPTLQSSTGGIFRVRLWTSSRGPGSRSNCFWGQTSVPSKSLGSVPSDVPPPPVPGPTPLLLDDSSLTFFQGHLDRLTSRSPTSDSPTVTPVSVSLLVLLTVRESC